MVNHRLGFYSLLLVSALSPAALHASEPFTVTLRVPVNAVDLPAQAYYIKLDCSIGSLWGSLSSGSTEEASSDYLTIDTNGNTNTVANIVFELDADDPKAFLENSQYECFVSIFNQNHSELASHTLQSSNSGSGFNPSQRSTSYMSFNDPTQLIDRSSSKVSVRGSFKDELEKNSPQPSIRGRFGQ